MKTPNDWKEAEAWQVVANSEKSEFSEPTWNWDCNFKLDFDGPIIHASSRFYPPHKNSSGKWEGSVEILLKEKQLHIEEFVEVSLDDLKTKVETYIQNYFSKLLKSDL